MKVSKEIDVYEFFDLPFEARKKVVREIEAYLPGHFGVLELDRLLNKTTVLYTVTGERFDKVTGGDL